MAVIVTLCVPTSLAFGVHEKKPDDVILELEILVPLKESCTLYTGEVNPYGYVCSETTVPDVTEEFGDGAVSDTETPELTLMVIDVFALCPEVSLA